MPTGPVPGGRTCQQIANEIATLVNAEILLLASNDVAQTRLTNAMSAYNTAWHAAQITQMALDGNRAQQLALHGEANAKGC
jgi:hypothetical protein